MSNEQMINQLENMAGQAFRSWGVTDDLSKESMHSQAYALCCTAIAALNAPKPFLQIGPDFFNRSDIVRVEIKEAGGYYNGDPKKIELYTRDLVGSECYSSCSTCHIYKYDSFEGKAILAWLQGQSEVIVSYEVLDLVSEGNESPDPFLASQAESMLAEANDEEIGHPF
jgi:hypothetical protein